MGSPVKPIGAMDAPGRRLVLRGEAGTADGSEAFHTKSARSIGGCHAERREASRCSHRLRPFAPLRVTRVTVQADLVSHASSQEDCMRDVQPGQSLSQAGWRLRTGPDIPLSPQLGLQGGYRPGDTTGILHGHLMLSVGEASRRRRPHRFVAASRVYRGGFPNGRQKKAQEQDRYAAPGLSAALRSSNSARFPACAGISKPPLSTISAIRFVPCAKTPDSALASPVAYPSDILLHCCDHDGRWRLFTRQS
jgi:hypothetical protein